MNEVLFLSSRRNGPPGLMAPSGPLTVTENPGRVNPGLPDPYHLVDREIEWPLLNGFRAYPAFNRIRESALTSIVAVPVSVVSTISTSVSAGSHFRMAFDSIMIR